MAGINANEFRSVMDELIAAVDQFRIALTGGSAMAQAEADAYREDSQRNREAIKKNTKETDENTKAKKAATTAVNALEVAGKALVKEFINIGNSGIKLAQNLGINATQGVQLEINNRKALLRNLTTFNADLQVLPEQLEATQKAFADFNIGLKAGTQMSAEGSYAFVQQMQGVFGSEFAPTAETMRMFTQMGISSTQQMEALRKSTGRQTIRADQLANLYSKNTLSFLLYGNSFSKAALQAERLGVNLASIQAAQEGLVTNLDGTIDTVAQINQLGGQIDFGTLVRIAETEGPAALMSYVRATVPEQMMQSASTRALFKQLGISVEDYIKSGQKQESAADQLEAKMTEAATGVGIFARTAATTAKIDTTLQKVFGELYTATKQAIQALIDFAKQLGVGAITRLLGGIPGIPGGAPPTIGPQPASLLTRLGSKIPIGGPAGMATSLGAASTTAIIGTAAAGAAIGLTIGNQFNKSVAEGGGGNLGNWWYQMTGLKRDEAEANELQRQIIDLARRRDPSLKPEIDRLTKQRQDIEARMTRLGDDIISPGYGSRTLVTPTGNIALNNADDVIAGTQLFSKGSLGLGLETNNYTTERLQRDTSELLRKVQTLIDTLATATTTVTINNNTQKIPRMQLVSVHSRNEVV